MTPSESASPTDSHVAVESAWREHSPALLAFARTLTRDAAEAEDWVAEAFARTMAAVSRGRGPTTDIRGYLFAVVRSLRAEAARRPVRVEPVAAMPEQHPELNAPDRADHVVDAIVAARAFASLPRRWQEVVHMVSVDDARVDKVAEHFDITPNAASVLTRRASEGLRAAYLQQWCPPASEDACELFRPDLVALVRETLPPARAARVHDHMDDCEDCTAVAALLRGEARRLRSVPLWLLLPAAPMATSSVAGVLDGSQLGGAPTEGASGPRRGHRKPHSPRPGALVGIAASGIAILTLATGAVSQPESAGRPAAPRVAAPLAVADPTPTVGDGAVGAVTDQPAEPTVRPSPAQARPLSAGRLPELGVAPMALPVTVLPPVPPVLAASPAAPPAQALPSTRRAGPPPRWFRASTKGKRVACLKHDLKICSLRP